MNVLIACEEWGEVRDEFAKRGHRYPRDLGMYGCTRCNGARGPAKLVYANQTPGGQNRVPPGPDRYSIRSRTYHGIAVAMATQWG